MSGNGASKYVRRADLWVPLIGTFGDVHLHVARLREALQMSSAELQSVRLIEFQILSYHCDGWPVFLSLTGDLGKSFNRINHARAQEPCFAVLFGVSQKPYPHAAFGCEAQSHDLSRGLWFNLSAGSHGETAPADSGFLLRIGVAPGHGHLVVRNDSNPLKSPVLRRIKATPEPRRLYRDFDESPTFPRFGGKTRDGEWSEGDLPTPYHTTDTENTRDSTTTFVVIGEDETSTASSSSSLTSSEEKATEDAQVEDTPPPHPRRSGSDAPTPTRAAAAAVSRARDSPSPSGSMENVMFL